jgi:hypothetical protein
VRQRPLSNPSRERYGVERPGIEDAGLLVAETGVNCLVAVEASRATDIQTEARPQARPVSTRQHGALMAACTSDERRAVSAARRDHDIEGSAGEVRQRRSLKE